MAKTSAAQQRAVHKYVKNNSEITILFQTERKGNFNGVYRTI